MDSLRDWSEQITANLNDLRRELEKQKVATVHLIDETTKELKEASAQGDRSENAAFSEALSKLSMCNVTLSTLDTQLKSIEDKVHEENYRSIGLVTEYATVKLLLQDSDNREFVVKIYPAGVSEIQLHILAADCPIGKAIMLREKEDIVTVEHSVTGEPLRYKIVDIY